MGTCVCTCNTGKSLMDVSPGVPRLRNSVMLTLNLLRLYSFPKASLQLPRLSATLMERIASDPLSHQLRGIAATALRQRNLQLRMWLARSE
jgi:hypothetical protein